MEYKKYARIVILLIAFCSIIAFYIAKDLQFNYSIESYFPSTDQEVEFYQDFTNEFERDIDFLLIGIENNKGAFDQEFLSKVKNFTSEIKSLDDVQKVTSPTNLKTMVYSPLGFSEVQLLHLNDEIKLKKDSARIYTENEWVGNYFSRNGKAVILVIKTTDKIQKVQGEVLLENINNSIRKYNFDNFKVAGRIRSQQYYISQMGKEFILFSTLSVVLLVVFLFAIYRSFWTIAVSGVVIGLSIVWTIAIIILISGQMNMLLTMLPVLLFVIGISDIIHIITKYIEELRNGVEKTEAILITLKEVGLATFLTSFTTAIGFLTLVTSNSPPIREFGLYIAIGVMITYFISILLLPALLMLFKKPKIGMIHHNSPSFWNRILKNGNYWMFNNKSKIIVATIIITIISSFGIFNIKVNNYFLDDIDEKSALKQDLNFFESNFEGIRPFEIAIYSTEKNINVLDFKVIQDIIKIENYLKENYQVGTIFSPLEIIRKFNKAMHTGNPDFYKVPENEEEYNKIIQKLKKYKILNKSSAFINNDLSKCRISSKINDTGSSEIKQQNIQFHKFIKSEIKSPLAVTLTGMPHLLDATNSYITTRLVRGLSLAILVIAVVIGLMFRSFKIVIISLIPNIIPLLFIGGIMGYFDMDLKISTGIVFTIAFGIAVDDTIHFLSKFKIELAKGKSVPISIKRTFLSTGKAIVLTSVVLSSGFISFTLSDFQSTILIGVLICITLLSAVLADLFLLPLLILKFYKK